MAKYTALFPGIANGTTADGGQVRQELDALGNAANDITNDQISASANIAISKTALGTYTAWTAWTPTLAAVGGGSLGSSAIGVSRWTQIGKVAILQIQVLGTVSGAVSQLTFTAPVAPLQSTANLVGSGCLIFDNGSPKAGTVVYTGTVFGVSKLDNSNWGATANDGYSVNLSYEVA